MESVIGSKKYFKSLGPTESDYYRHKTGFLPTNYSSYNNTLGRCSTGPYVHLNNFPLHVDVGNGMAMANHYRYNSWGMMNDCGSRKLAPSISYSSAGDSQKTRVKSFTILLMTAAFIVMLAVLSVAGLAFYFSTFKSEFSEPLMAFDGEFMVVRGDVFTTGLKYNHTTAFEQKSHVYEQMILKAVAGSGLVVLRCEVLGFGEGPLINVIFRIYLDIRKIPNTISSIEDHIIDAIVNEFAIPSTTNSIKIDRHSVQVKRIFNNDQLGTASLMGPSHSTIFDAKHSAESRFSTEPAAAHQTHHNQNARNEATSDKEHSSGVLHGSFEVTKTDADITQKKSSPQFPATSTTTLRPFNVTNVGGSIKVKTKKITIEKVTLPTKATLPTQEYTISPVTSPKTEAASTHRTAHRTTSVKPVTSIKPSTTTTTTTTTTSTTTTTTTTTTERPKTTSTERSTTLKQPKTTVLPQTTTVNHKTSNVQANHLPQLNEQLFTRAPILDNKPWLPIDPTISVMQTNTDAASLSSSSSSSLNNVYSHRLTTDDFDTTSTTTQPNRVYHSFSNPAFVTSLQSIEHLGSNAVRRYPIPVDKINMHNNSPIRQTPNRNETPNKMHATNGNYEHLGGGIMVKKSEEKKKETSTTSPKPTTTIEQLTSLGIPIVVNQTQLVTVLSVIDTNTMSSVTLPPTTEEVPHQIDEQEEESTTKRSKLPIVPSSTYVRIDTLNPSASSPVVRNTTEWDQPLFPMNLKPGSIESRNKSPIRKTYNDTLQAWIVENDQSNKPNQLRPIVSTPPTKSNIQNISVIFDTLASKLGITSNNVPTKGPTLFTNTQHKLNLKISNRTNVDLTKNINSNNTTTITTTPTTSTTITTTTEPASLLSSLPTEPVYGEAEIEEVDPTQYEEILQSDRMRTRHGYHTTEPTVTLITLMPVKSNSGLRLPILLESSGSAEETREFDGLLQHEF